MKKRILSLVLALLLVCSLLPVPAHAAEEVASGTCGENLTWSFDPETGTLTISGTGAMENYDETEPSFYHAPWIAEQLSVYITNVIIEEGVTSIGEYAFYDLNDIVSVLIPETVVEIGTGAFIRCENLVEITLPDGLTELGYRVFEGCTSLSSINIPDGVPAIRQKTFSGCYALTQVVISENSAIDHIGPDAFYNCACLEAITLPNGVQQIGTRSFQTTGISTITIPASVTQIEDSAFSSCIDLTEIIFTGNAPQFGENVFYNDTTTAYYPPDNSTWTEDVMQNYGGKITWSPTHTHEYSSEVTAPTCTEQGYTTYTCDVCGNVTVGDYVDALGHEEVIDEGTPATCTEAGLSDGSHCTVCESILTEQEEIPATGHAWDEGIVTKEATEEENGEILYTCETCGETLTEELEYVPVVRLYGAGRCETAIEVADMMKETLGVDTFDAIIIANGDNFADALAGSYLAAQKNAPILLYRSSAITMNREYIQENLSEGGIVYLLGGTSAVPADVESDLNDVGIEVKRLAGNTRFDTNLEILLEAGIEAGQEILVATGYNFADSLSASATGLPILMVNNSTGVLTDAQVEFLESLEDCTFTIIGGTSAVSEDLEDMISEYGEVSRLAGINREATSVLVAETYFDTPERIVLAYSRNFPDGLCGGPLAYILGAPLILTNAGQETAAADYVADNGITKGLVLGGTSVLSDVTVNTVYGTN